MYKITRIGLLSVTMGALAACGGGGDQMIVPEPPTLDPTEEPTATSSDFSILEAAFNALESSIPPGGALPADVPTTGTATFTGLFSGELDPNVNTTATDIANGNVDFIAGDAQILVDFGDDDKTIGAIGNLQSDTVDDISGTIVLFDFETTRGTNAVVFEGNYGGELTITDGDYPTGAQQVAGRFGGGYFGDDGEYISLITTPVDGFNDIYFDGDVVLEEE